MFFAKINPFMHNVFKVATLPEKEIHLVFLLKYLIMCDHFAKICIKGLTEPNTFFQVGAYLMSFSRLLFI